MSELVEQFVAGIKRVRPKATITVIGPLMVQEDNVLFGLQDKSIVGIWVEEAQSKSFVPFSVAPYENWNDSLIDWHIARWLNVPAEERNMYLAKHPCFEFKACIKHCECGKDKSNAIDPHYRWCPKYGE